jgi:plasmid maintenance system antidote protein VapI
MKLRTPEQLQAELVKLLTTTTQAELAAELDTSQGYISDIAKGQRAISAKFAKKLGYVKKIFYVPIK